ncbi:tetratricopeptide repeat protein, partial [Noviherbaspirillum sp.]|uniref:tetratricopeptide repeat protein n=1 Tax=Noviherbaspirillum sp. TaxID=1926288 RepID=UPI002FE081C6
LKLSILEQQAYAEPADAPGRDVMRGLLRQQLRAMQRWPLTGQRLLELGRKAMRSSETTVASAVYQRIATSAEEMPAAFYDDAARGMLGIGDYRTSALLYLRAMQQSTAIDRQRRLFMDAIGTLQAGGFADEALAAAERHIGPLGNDTETLRFLVRVAQANNRLDFAERYVKRMLRMSFLDREPGIRSVRHQTPYEWLASLGNQDAGPARLVRVAGPAATVPAAGTDAFPAAPFDEESYRLGFEVFLANRNLDAARRLAVAAVRQRPDAAEWRKRLAQTSEWSGAPQDALPQWLAYARMTGSEEGWDAVLRLSEGLFDQAALETALRHKVVSEPRKRVWMERLLALYENAGQADKAMQALRDRLGVNNRGEVVGRSTVSGAEREGDLELLAGLASRGGKEAELIAALRRLQSEFRPNAARALRIATLLYQRGQVDKAFDELARSAPQATLADAAFWRAYAQIAAQLQNDAVAQEAYRKLVEGNAHNGNDASNLFSLLSTDHPRAAALLAEAEFARSGNPEFAKGALNTRLAAADFDGAHRFLQGLSRDALATLEQDADFLAGRAAVEQARNNLPGAMRDLRAALKLAPDSADFRAGMLWAMIAARDTAPLKEALAAWAHDAETTPSLWGPFAAANMAINRQATALHWFRKDGFPRDDYLWLMSYAECLDANSQPDLAWRIRRRAWLDLRKPEVLRNAPPDQLRALRDRLAATAPLFMGGDGARQVVQALLRADVTQLVESGSAAAAPLPKDGKSLLEAMDRADREPIARAAAVPADPARMFAPGSGQRPRDDARLTASVRELALAYALNRQANDLAAAWLATRYAGQLSKPLWGDLAMVLNKGDRHQLDDMLDKLPDWLPMYDRVEAAERAGRPGLAQTLAFDQLALLDADEQLHLRLTNLTVNEPAAFQFNRSRLDDPALHIDRTEATAGLQLTNGMKLSLTLSHRDPQSIDPAVLRGTPRRDNEAELTLRKRTPTGYAALSVQTRQAAANVTGMRLDFDLSPASPLRLTGNIGIHQRAVETPLLRIGGMRSGVDANLTYQLSRAEYLRLSLGWQRYASQEGTSLGTGRSWTAEAGSHLRLEYPNLTVRTFATGSRFDDDGRIDASLMRYLPEGRTDLGMLPTDSVSYGVSVGIGTVVDGRYTRALRPFFEAGLLYNRDSGRNYNLSGGVAGSVLGQDVLTLRFQRSSGTPTIPRGFQELGINYKWLY